MIYDNTSFYRTHYYRFDSVHEMITESAKAYKEARHTKFNSMYNRIAFGNEAWMGRLIHNVDHAAKLADSEWPEGLKMIDSLLDKVRGVEFAKPEAIRRVSSWSEDHGDEVDLDRFRAAQPYWRTTERKQRPGPVNKTIVVNSCDSMKTQSQAITWRGVAAIVLTELLEEAGYRCDIHCAVSSDDSYTDKHTYAMSVMVKGSGDPIDRSSLANVMSGWFFRGITLPGIAIRGGQYLYPDRSGGVNWIGHWAKKITYDDKAAVADTEVNSEYTAVAWIKNKLKELTDPPKPIENYAPIPVVETVAVVPPSPPPRKLTAAEELRERKEQERRYKELEKYLKEEKIRRRIF